MSFQPFDVKISIISRCCVCCEAVRVADHVHPLIHTNNFSNSISPLIKNHYETIDIVFFLKDYGVYDPEYNKIIMLEQDTCWIYSPIRPI
jgi:hypothetical protein